MISTDSSAEMPGVYRKRANVFDVDKPFNDLDSFLRVSGGIVGVAESHPACTVFVLGDGDRVTLWHAGDEHDARWEVDR